jgi:proteasome lid subunit RPN8/RPN11
MPNKTVGNVTLDPATIFAAKAVKDVFLASFNKTQDKKQEHGGWIYFNATSNAFKMKEKTQGDANSIILTPVPAVDTGYQVVADWHCHPGKHVGACRPSDPDIENAKSKNYFMFVLTNNKEPKSGWQVDLLKKISIVDDNATYRLWNIT